MVFDGHVRPTWGTETLQFDLDLNRHLRRTVLPKRVAKSRRSRGVGGVRGGFTNTTYCLLYTVVVLVVGDWVGPLHAVRPGASADSSTAMSTSTVQAVCDRRMSVSLLGFIRSGTRLLGRTNKYRSTHSARLLAYFLGSRPRGETMWGGNFRSMREAECVALPEAIWDVVRPFWGGQSWEQPWRHVIAL